MKLRNNRPKFLATLSKWLDKEIKIGLEQARDNRRHWIFNAGYCRGGSQNYGGITWCDYIEEFYPTIGLNQICGHTSRQHEINYIQRELAKPFVELGDDYVPTLKTLSNTNLSTNVCLDVAGNMHWAVWDGKTLKIDNYLSL